MKSNKFLLFYGTFSTTKSLLHTYTTLRLPQIIVFGAIVALLDKTGATTQYEVIKLNTGQNKALSKTTTVEHIKKLETEGFIIKTKSPQYFSRSYITLTKSGLLLKSRLSSLLDSSLLPGE